ADRQPDRVALETPERSLTYAELRDAAVAAGGLRGARRVAIALPAGVDFVIAVHACLVAGAAVVPIDLRLGEAEQEQRLAGADVVVSQPLRRSAPGDLAAGDLAAGDLECVDRDTPVAVMHTSGTTAAPKPVVLTHGNFLASAVGSAVALGLDPAERWLCPMPLTHVGGLSIAIRSAIYATTAVVHGRFDTDAVLSELMDPTRRITLVSLVPTMLARLLDAGLERPPTLRWALLGGGPIAPALVTRAEAAGVPVAPTYGMTEACSQIATFGWPLAGVDLRVADDGEVLVRGPVVSAGALAADGWLHTGDLGRLDSRSRLEIAGRKADTIVTGGENVAPAEVEAVLLEHPAVADAAVHPRVHPEWGEAVVATVVLRDGGVAAPEELRTHCAARLAGFKVPKVVEFADVLPRTASGKLLRRQL
ncbi:MAG TPA: AMP-binding protein, partial [Solirubrobacteraceae bacterium]|nr:AMP-binding protein [Solirubrobacteraceae bacterium]